MATQQARPRVVGLPPVRTSFTIVAASSVFAPGCMPSHAAAAARHRDFLRGHRRGRVLHLEIGVRGNTPIIIKFPFWRMMSENPHAIYACVNPGEAFAPAQIANRSILIDADAAEAIAHAAA